MKRALAITTPATRGAAVVRAQRILSGLSGGKYGNLLRDKVDGVFGPHTAAAAFRAHHWLGYPASKRRRVYTAELERYLLGAPLPPAMRLRRKLRLAAQAKANAVASKRKRMVAVAKGEVGTHERGTSNVVKYSTWYGMIGPWCLMFVTWCGVTAGLTKAFKRGVRWAYCPFLDADADAGRNSVFTVPFTDTGEGDIATLHFGGGESKHVGIIAARRGAFLVMVEGNTAGTASGSQDDGGTVAVKVRPRSHVRRTIRVAG